MLYLLPSASHTVLHNPLHLSLDRGPHVTTQAQSSLSEIEKRALSTHCFPGPSFQRNLITGSYARTLAANAIHAYAGLTVHWAESVAIAESSSTPVGHQTQPAGNPVNSDLFACHMWEPARSHDSMLSAPTTPVRWGNQRSDPAKCMVPD